MCKRTTMGNRPYPKPSYPHGQGCEKAPPTRLLTLDLILSYWLGWVMNESMETESRSSSGTKSRKHIWLLVFTVGIDATLYVYTGVILPNFFKVWIEDIKTQFILNFKTCLIVTTYTCLVFGYVGSCRTVYKWKAFQDSHAFLDIDNSSSIRTSNRIFCHYR
jgi:hypothetical protein